MQTLCRLMLPRRRVTRAATALLAIAALIGSVAGPVSARASCAPRATVAAKHCAYCRHTAPSAKACSMRRVPCCACAIGAEAPARATTASVQLERPASSRHGIAAAHGAAAPAAPRLVAVSATLHGPPFAPADPRHLTTLLRL